MRGRRVRGRSCAREMRRSASCRELGSARARATRARRGRGRAEVRLERGTHDFVDHAQRFASEPEDVVTTPEVGVGGKAPG